MLNYTTIHAILGKGFADKQEEVVFESGYMQYTRRNFTQDIGCANLIAAGRLAKVCRRLKINTLPQLFKTDPYSLYRCKGIGDASLFVAMCILDSSGFDAVKWWGPEKQEKLKRAKKRKQEV